MGCHEAVQIEGGPTAGVIVLAGQPNVGKSVLFKRLTGHYVAVSNYPGTTIEVARGRVQTGDRLLTMLDAPGINSLQPLADDERVTRKLLLTEEQATVVQVGDAKNMARTLLLTLQFAELEIPLVLDLNMADEARQRGVKISWQLLSEMLGVEVIPTVATRGTGIDALRGSLDSARIPTLTASYGQVLEQAICEVENVLPEGRSGKRGLAVMLLTGDPDLESSLSLAESAKEQIRQARQGAQEALGRPVAQVVTQKRWEAVDAALAGVYERDAHYKPSIAERVGRWAVHPVAGWPILLLILYLV